MAIKAVLSEYTVYMYLEALEVMHVLLTPLVKNNKDTDKEVVKTNFWVS